MFQKPIEKCQGMPKCKVNTDNFNVVIDQFDSQSFNQNDAGWIRNSIFELQRAQSKSEYDAIMSRLLELKFEGGIAEGTSIDDAISQIKPRWAQSPNEIEQFISMTNGDVMKKLDEAYKKTLQDDKDEKKDSDPSPTLTPSESAEL